MEFTVKYLADKPVGTVIEIAPEVVLHKSVFGWQRGGSAPQTDAQAAASIARVQKNAKV